MIVLDWELKPDDEAEWGLALEAERDILTDLGKRELEIREALSESLAMFRGKRLARLHIEQEAAYAVVGKTFGSMPHAFPPGSDTHLNEHELDAIGVALAYRQLLHTAIVA